MKDFQFNDHSRPNRTGGGVSIFLGKGFMIHRRLHSGHLYGGIRATTNGLKTSRGPGSEPVTTQLLHLGPSARDHYAMRLDKERKEKEEAQRQLVLQKEQSLQVEAQKQPLAKEKTFRAKRKH